MNYRALGLSIVLTSFISFNACSDSVSADPETVPGTAEEISSSSEKSISESSSSSEEATKVSSSSEEKKSAESSSSQKDSVETSSSSEATSSESLSSSEESSSSEVSSSSEESSSSQEEIAEVSSSSEIAETCKEGDSKDSTFVGMFFKYACTNGEWVPDQLYFAQASKCDEEGATKDEEKNGVMTHLTCLGTVWQVNKTAPDLNCTEEGATKFDRIANIWMDLVCKKSEYTGKLTWTPDSEAMKKRSACSKEQMDQTRDTVVAGYIVTQQCVENADGESYKWTTMKTRNMADCSKEEEGEVVEATILGNKGAYVCTEGFWAVQDIYAVAKCDTEGAIDEYTATDHTVYPMICKDGGWTVDKSRVDQY